MHLYVLEGAFDAPLWWFAGDSIDQVIVSLEIPSAGSFDLTDSCYNYRRSEKHLKA